MIVLLARQIGSGGPQQMNFKKTVLLLEDDTDIVYVIQYVLENEGFVVVTSDLRSYRKDIDTCHPDLIIVDDWLPGKPGSCVCEELKTNTQTLEIPVILASTTGNVEATAQICRADGALAMPFDIDEFVDKVYKLVNRNRETSAAFSSAWYLLSRY